MINTLLGSKQKMSVSYTDTARVPVTLVSTGPCVVTQIRQMDGFWAVQLGFGLKKAKNTSKPLQGHLKTKKDDKTAPHYLKEVRTEEEPELKVGDKVVLTDVFAIGDTVNVTGVSKGKGFAGVVKRWHFRGGSKTHGQSDRLRAPGSIGQGTTPGRVYKGKHMAGRMGGEQKTIKNLKVMTIDVENNILGISGAIPGTKDSLVIIKRTSEKQIIEPQETQEIVEGATNE